jgi:hypothetical protein
MATRSAPDAATPDRARCNRVQAQKAERIAASRERNKRKDGRGRGKAPGTGISFAPAIGEIGSSRDRTANGKTANDEPSERQTGKGDESQAQDRERDRVPPNCQILMNDFEGGDAIHEANGEAKAAARTSASSAWGPVNRTRSASSNDAPAVARQQTAVRNIAAQRDSRFPTKPRA